MVFCKISFKILRFLGRAFLSYTHTDMGKDNFHIGYNKEVISTFVMPTIVLHMAHFAPALNVKWGLACGFILYY
jgi:hypothetical protein